MLDKRCHLTPRCLLGDSRERHGHQGGGNNVSDGLCFLFRQNELFQDTQVYRVKNSQKPRVHPPRTHSRCPQNHPSHQYCALALLLSEGEALPTKQISGCLLRPQKPFRVSHGLAAHGDGWSNALSKLYGATPTSTRLGTYVQERSPHPSLCVYTV